jgi:outer membrane protein OmpA-like peptidoglycan-associated protein
MTVSFAPQSAEIDADSRNALDALARSLARRGVKQVELRAYSTGDPGTARKVALARALSVRSYLIDQGVKARIEVGGFSTAPRGSAGDRVDVVTP